MNNPVVSVLMITYGHEKFIIEAINSILIQECNFEIELIISNDCSPDKTDDIITNFIKNNEKASKIIKYFKQENNIGMMPNCIFALKQCSGKYIALCDGDDYWTDKNKLQTQVDFLNANKDYVLSFHKVAILKSDGSIVDDFITKVPENYETQETLARFGNYIHTPSVVFRNCIKEFPFEFSQTKIGDYFLYMMITENGKIKFIPEVMAIYREGVGVISKMSNATRFISEINCYSCIASYSNDNNIKKIFFDRQNEVIIKMERLLNKQNQNYFINKNILLKMIMSLINRYNKFKSYFQKA